MADINLTQADADVLLAMEKHKVEDTPYEYPTRDNSSPRSRGSRSRESFHRASDIGPSLCGSAWLGCR